MLALACLAGLAACLLGLLAWLAWRACLGGIVHLVGDTHAVYQVYSTAVIAIVVDTRRGEQNRGDALAVHDHSKAFILTDEQQNNR